MSHAESELTQGQGAPAPAKRAPEHVYISLQPDKEYFLHKIQARTVFPTKSLILPFLSFSVVIYLVMF